MDWKSKIKNPYFWLGLAGVVLAAMGVEPEMFTSWSIVAEKAIELVSNPFMLVSVIVAVLGVITNPNTKGLKD